MEHPWATHRACVGKIPPLAWLETNWCCGLCSVSSVNARTRNYQHLVEEMAWDSLENPAKDLIGGMQLGSNEFVDLAKATPIQTGAMDIHHNLRAGLASGPP